MAQAAAAALSLGAELTTTANGSGGGGGGAGAEGELLLGNMERRAAVSDHFKDLIRPESHPSVDTRPIISPRDLTLVPVCVCACRVV